MISDIIHGPRSSSTAAKITTAAAATTKLGHSFIFPGVALHMYLSIIQNLFRQHMNITTLRPAVCAKSSFLSITRHACSGKPVGLTCATADDHVYPSEINRSGLASRACRETGLLYRAMHNPEDLRFWFSFHSPRDHMQYRNQRRRNRIWMKSILHGSRHGCSLGADL